MGCCDETTALVPGTDVSRRSLFKGAALIASVIPAVRPTGAGAQGKAIKLAYCSQLLCGVPYEVARTGGYFKNHGLDVQIVYTRGGNAAMQALVAGAVDYAATSLYVAIQAYANVGADIRRFAVTGRLPLFAIVTAPKTAAQIRSIKDLEGKTVGVSALGTADHALTLYLLRQAGADGRKVQFRDHWGQPAGGVAPGPGRRRLGAGAGADAGQARGRTCAGERHGSRGGRALSRRLL
jgi:NitT/TauT family transport system substrate-binding protein